VDDLGELTAQWNELASRLGPESVAIGSDFNGAITHLKPTRCARTGTSLDSEGGLWNIGQTADLWKAMKSRGAKLPQGGAGAMIDHFIDTWAQVENVQD
jgi:hypothetical protein